MEGTKISDFFGKKVKVWLLGQSQLNITPGMVIEGTLIGLDQGAYIVSSETTDGQKALFIPVSQCKISVIE